MTTETFNTELAIPCQVGALEARILYRENTASCGVIICPPHPLLAGNMDNNVVQALAKTLCKHFPVLLFNYQGVGKSSSSEPDLTLFEFWDRLDASGDFSAIISDSRTVVNWSRKLFPQNHLIGYSFGALMAMHVAEKEQTASLTAITPPLNAYDFSALHHLQTPVTLFLAEQDDLVQSGAFVQHHKIPVITLSGTDHFFRTREKELAGLVQKNLA